MKQSSYDCKCSIKEEDGNLYNFENGQKQFVKDSNNFKQKLKLNIFERFEWMMTISIIIVAMYLIYLLIVNITP